MRILFLLAVSTTLSCALFAGDETRSERRSRSNYGLERVQLPIPGTLEILRDHRIGSYDSLLIPNVTVSYEQGSAILTPDAKRAFATLLRDSIVQASVAAAIPIAQAPGPCVMEIGIRVAKMNLDVADRADQLVDLTVIMTFRDSMTRLRLLRYAREGKVKNPSVGVTADTQLRKGLDQLAADLNLASSLRPAGLADDTLIPGCQGTLAARGRAAQQP